MQIKNVELRMLKISREKDPQNQHYLHAFCLDTDLVKGEKLSRKKVWEWEFGGFLQNLSNLLIFLSGRQNM